MNDLVAVFRASRSKHEANRAAAPIMEQLTREPAFLSAILAKYLSAPGSLTRKNYPVVGMEIASNPWFGLVANCWIPLPGRETHISTKAIHHHGNMLLTTATLYGPGYEHWMFSRPTKVDAASGLHEMDLLEAAPHPHEHVSFVDAWIPHTPFYPRDLSITLALWSNQLDTTWRDHLKRMPGISHNANRLRDVAVKLGLREAFDLKVVESYDFYPTAEGFQVMPVRQEFGLGPVEDHLHSVFHVVQQTGNEHLEGVIRRTVAEHRLPMTMTLEGLLADLARGRPIEGKLSSMHHGIPYANFTRDDVWSALRALGKKNEDGGKLAPAESGQATHRASAH